MKKNVLCVFSLLLYILVACTLVSQKIETEMTTLAEVREVDFTKFSGKNVEISWVVLFEGPGDAAYNFYLYEVVDGTGWESGLRLQEIPRSNWTLTLPDGIVRMPVDRDYRLVKSASRNPLFGDRVEILKIKLGNDRYLAIYTKELTNELSLPSSAEVAAQSSNALLLNMTNVSTPFLEHRARGMSVTMDTATRIFSLTDVAQFLENIPPVTLLFTVLLIPFLIWLYSCLLVRDYWENRIFLFVNAGMVVALLCFAVWLMKRIDLPASMLPDSNILQFDYYSNELTMIFNALHELGDAAPDITGMADEVRQSALEYAAKGALSALAVILIETVTVCCRSYKRSKHAKRKNAA